MNFERFLPILATLPLAGITMQVQAQQANAVHTPVDMSKFRDTTYKEVVGNKVFSYDTPASRRNAKGQTEEDRSYMLARMHIAPDMSNIEENIKFDNASHTIPDHYKPQLAKLAKILKENPDATLDITGTTDRVGSAPYNQALSERRTASVVTALTDLGVSPAQLINKSTGLGEIQQGADEVENAAFRGASIKINLPKKYVLKDVEKFIRITNQCRDEVEIINKIPSEFLDAAQKKNPNLTVKEISAHATFVFEENLSKLRTLNFKGVTAENAQNFSFAINQKESGECRFMPAQDNKSLTIFSGDKKLTTINFDEAVAHLVKAKTISQGVEKPVAMGQSGTYTPSYSQQTFPAKPASVTSHKR